MLKLSNAPEIEIEWGSQTPENRKKWIDWVFKNLNSIATNKNIKSDELKSLLKNFLKRLIYAAIEKAMIQLDVMMKRKVFKSDFFNFFTES